MTGSTKLQAFFDDIEVVCKKHGLSISHQDDHGAFVIVPYAERYTQWLQSAEFHIPTLPEPSPSADYPMIGS